MSTGNADQMKVQVLGSMGLKRLFSSKAASMTTSHTDKVVLKISPDALEFQAYSMNVLVLLLACLLGAGLVAALGAAGFYLLSGNQPPEFMDTMLVKAIGGAVVPVLLFGTAKAASSFGGTVEVRIPKNEIKKLATKHKLIVGIEDRAIVWVVWKGGDVAFLVPERKEQELHDFLESATEMEVA